MWRTRSGGTQASNFVVARKWFHPAVKRVFDNSIRRHVAKTGDIKHFVITEESGIAKGIRRITALTGAEAQRVISLANNFAERIKLADGLPSSAKEAELKALTVVGSLQICSIYQ